MIVDAEGFMKVRIGGDVVRRRAYAVAVIDPGTQRTVATAYKPDLLQGEVLLEVLGDLPTILKAYNPT